MKKTVPRVLKHLANPQVINNLIVRHRIKQIVHSYLNSLGFIEIDTPILGPEIPEYATEQFEVKAPGGTKYWLPQSPAIYKQILMATEIEKYYQIAHCFRQEPRTPVHSSEFMQIDIEMKVDRIEEIMAITEGIIQEVCYMLELGRITPFPVMDAVECMSRYNSYTPDLRQNSDELSFLWIVNFPLLENIKIWTDTKVTTSQIHKGENVFIPSHNVFALPTNNPLECEYDELLDIKNSYFDLVLNGIEICSGGLRITDRDLQEDVMDFFSIDKSLFEVYLQILEHISKSGGMAMGLGRLTMLLTGAKHFNDVNAFPSDWWHSV